MSPFKHSLFKIDRNPNDRTLRQYAAASCVALPLVGSAAGGAIGAGCGAAVAAALVVLAVVRPQALRMPFLGLSYATAPIGLVAGEVLGAVMFFFVFAPIGFILRATGRDPLERRFRPEAKSYWTPKRPARGAASYLRQY